MKTMKKTLSLVLAIVMALALAMPAMAVDNEKTITLNGVAAGDNVKYYKVIEWNASSGWQFVSPFNTALTDAQKAEILGNANTPGKITDATATAMGGASGKTAIVADGDTVDGTSWTKTNQDPGLYMLLITSATPTAENDLVVYNPVFLAVQADNTGSVLSFPLSYPDNGTAKKSEVDVDKTAKGPNDQNYAEVTTNNVGDIIDFNVEVTVPAYLESWTDPTFTVTDSLTDGLTLAVGENNALTDITVTGATSGVLKTDQTDAKDNDYTVTKTATGYTITFTNKYLQGRTADEVVTITYQAKITTDAANVNPETNTVKIEYSNNPNNSGDHKTKEDKTTHYTFSIDAGLYGDTNYETSELVKVGKNADGSYVMNEKTYSNGTKHNALQGAEFALFTDAACTQRYTNSSITATTKFTTDENGKLNITGLDEGTYYLKEVTAAPGYQLITDAVQYTITATYRDVPATATCNAYKELSGYTVSVNGGSTSTYVFENGAITKTDSKAGDQTTEIVNTKGQELPSTGGIGTKIFYTMGAVLVIGAGVVLVSRKRAGE